MASPMARTKFTMDTESSDTPQYTIRPTTDKRTSATLKTTMQATARSAKNTMHTTNTAASASTKFCRASRSTTSVVNTAGQRPRDTVQPVTNDAQPNAPSSAQLGKVGA